ncbi:hypothetical protein BH09BAC5_BH09BAC5_13810 [soil metagenome]
MSNKHTNFIPKTMKKVIILSALFLSGFSAKALTDENDSLGLPGDNLDLYGVMDLFKQSSTLEEFEKKLNDPANEVNNLDLNNDNNVDYIRVIDQKDGDAHAFVLQVPVSATENQDVAAIELEKTGSETADIQIVGDEELYGADYVIEADEETSTGSDAKFQGFRPVVFVNVWMWPCVRFVYAPVYVVWVSPYRWAYYPSYWRPWHPVMWHVHHARVVHYHAHYVCVHQRRMEHAHACYYNHRNASPAVHQRYAENHQRHDAAQAHRNTPANDGRQQKNNNGGKKGKQNQASPRGGQKATKQNATPRGNGNKNGGQSKGGGGHKGGGRPR